MIFYSFEKLWLLGLGNPMIMVKAFQELVAGTEGYEVLKGEDFIVHQGVVTQNPYNLSYQQLAEYLGLCALRNYQNYRTIGYTDLDMAHVPEWVQPEVVKNHPLISLNKSSLIFEKEK